MSTESQRQKKFGSMILRDLSEMFQRDFKSLTGSAFVTITSVKMSPDLGVASVYLSFMLAPSDQVLLEQIQENTKTIRQELGKRIRHHVRIVPELRFFLDDTAEHAAKIDQLLSGLNIPKEDK